MRHVLVVNNSSAFRGKWSAIPLVKILYRYLNSAVIPHSHTEPDECNPILIASLRNVCCYPPFYGQTLQVIPFLTLSSRNWYAFFNSVLHM
jgi:hypothetical protein